MVEFGAYDIFLVGLKEEQFNDKIQEIYDTICYANPLVDILVVRTKNCISFEYNVAWKQDDYTNGI